VNIVLISLPLVCVATLGIAVICRAEKLSIRYNAWTTEFRERHPHINPPPTPQMRALNTKIMTWLFRALGAFFALYSIITLVSILGS
jgi:hypothetical protein